MLLLSLLVSLSALFSAATAQLSNAATLPATIRSQAAYSLLPGCINQCVWDIGDNDTPDIGGDLAIHLSCSRPWVNGCYCRGASAAVAYTFLTSCFSYLCTTPAASDIDAGVSVYTSYCSQALGAAYSPNAIPQPAAADGVSVEATPAPTAVGASSRPVSAMPSQTGQADSTAATDAANVSPKSEDDGKIAGLSSGAFIGIMVSASCSVIGLLFGVAFKVYSHKKKTRLQREQVERLQYQAKA